MAYPSEVMGVTEAALAADYSPTGAEADIGLSVIVPRAGTYLVTVTLDCDIATGDTFVIVYLNVGGVNNDGIMWGKRSGSHAVTSSVSKTWRVTTAGASGVVKVRALKSGGGASKFWSTHSSLVVCGPVASALPT